MGVCRLIDVPAFNWNFQADMPTCRVNIMSIKHHYKSGHIFCRAASSFAAVAAACFMLISNLGAVPHINGKDMGPKEYVHRPEQVPGGAAEYGISKTITTTGTRKVAVILVDFLTAGSATSGANAMSSSDIIGLNTTFGYLRDFYAEASYGKLNVDITFYYSGGSTKTLTGYETPYTLNSSMSSYGQDTDPSLSKLVIDALNAVGGAVKHTSAGGIYDGVMVAHAGYGNESTDNAGDIWSAYIGPFANTYGFTEGTIAPAKESPGDSPIGVTCHEFGHHLGLWDLYATDATGGRAQVGDWSLMDNGAWAGSPVAGSQPTQPSAWEKKQLGWLDFNDISSSTGTHNLRSYAFETSSATVFKLEMENSSDTEYFIVCYTSNTAKSPASPGTGLLIWHIDEGPINGVTLAAREENNTLNNYLHRTVALEEADVIPPDYQGNLGPSNKGDSTDPWPGPLGTFTIPYSDNYDGLPSMVTVTNIFNHTDYSDFDVFYRPFVSGYVVDGAGSGISGVSVTANNNGSVEGTVTTGSDGSFIFTDLDPASYVIAASTSPVWRFIPAAQDVTVSTYSISGIRFTGLADSSYATLSAKPSSILAVNNLFTPGQNVSTVYYTTAADGKVMIYLYTLDGRLVRKLVDEQKQAGTYSVQWEGKNDSGGTVSSGIYLLRITAPGFKETKKICVIR